MSFGFVGGDPYYTEGAAELIPVQVTAASQSGGTWYYSWTEQTWDATTGVFSPASDPRTGTAAAGPFLVEINNVRVAPPFYAWIRKRGAVNDVNLYEFSAAAGTSAAYSSGTTVTFASGSTLSLQSGSTLNLQSGSTFNFSGTTTYPSGSVVDVSGSTWNIYAPLAYYGYGSGYVYYDAPVYLCGYLFWCCYTYSTFTTDQNDLAQPGFPGAVVYQVHGNAQGIQITGIAPTSLGAGPQIIALQNIGSGYLTIPSDSGSSLAANRIHLPYGVGSINLQPGEALILWYDTCSGIGEWRPIGYVNVLTGQGDLLYGGTGGLPTRLGIGTANQLLAASNGATQPLWTANVRSISGTYTVSATADNRAEILADASGGNVSINLPPATSAKSMFFLTVKKIDSSANTVTIFGDVGGADQIDGDAAFVIGVPDYALTLVCTGVAGATAWYCVRDYLGDAAANLPLVGQGKGNAPQFTTLRVPGGGTGLTTWTPYGLLAGGTTTTGSLQQVASLGTSGQVLTSQGSGSLPTWTTISAGSGTVTSVGLSLPAGIWTVSGSPVTGSGVITGSYAAEASGTAFMGPLSGAAAVPTFRALATSDMPSGVPVSSSGTYASGTATAPGQFPQWYKFSISYAAFPGAAQVYSVSTFPAGTYVSNGATLLTTPWNGPANPLTLNLGVSGSGNGQSLSTTAYVSSYNLLSGQTERGSVFAGGAAACPNFTGSWQVVASLNESSSGATQGNLDLWLLLSQLPALP